MATSSTSALSRAQQELDEARSAQFVAEEAHKTADAAAKLLAQKITGTCWWGGFQALSGTSLPCHQPNKRTLLKPFVVLLPAEIQREATQQQGIADAAKLELRNQVAGLMKDLEMQRQQAQVMTCCFICTLKCMP